VAWTRQAGSPGADSVVGADASSTSPRLFGFTSDSVNGEPVAGGVDAYFYGTAGALGDLKVYQLGTEGDETLAAALYSQDLFWLLGNSDGDYRITDGDVRALERLPLNSSAGFLLAYSAIGTTARAFTLNDTEDMAREHLQALSGFDGDIVVAGFSEGDFTGDSLVDGLTRGILARISPDADTEEALVSGWRYQLPVAGTEILKLGNYRDDEVTALVRQGVEQLILVFSPDGVLLTPVD